MRDALLRLLEPAIEALGFELIDVEFGQQGRGGIVRVFIDLPSGADRQVTVEDCATASHAVSRVLEEEDPIKGRYTLEVSSPGFDRILRKPAHFERFLGARVAVELKVPQDGRRRFVGVLKAIAGKAVAVETDGVTISLPLERISKARLKPA
jgi:ribosome maturation factor RimP